MKRFLKIVGALVVLLVVGAVAALFLIPTDRIVAVATNQIEAATGRTASLGAVEPSFWPVLGLRAEGVTLANAPGAARPAMIEAAEVAIGVEILPLLSGDIALTEIRIADAVIALEVASDGTPNWQFEEPKGADSGGGDSGALTNRIALPEAAITNATVFYSDATTGAAYGAEGIDLTLSLDAAPEALSVTAEGAATYAGEQLSLSLAATGGPGWAETQRFDAKISLEGEGFLALSYEGAIDLAVSSLAGAARIETSALTRLAALGGQALAPGSLPEAASVAGQLSVAEGGSVALQEATIALGERRVEGSLSVTPGEARPMIEADLSTGMLDLSTEIAAGRQGGGGAGEADSDTLDVSALRAADAEIALTAAEIVLEDGFSLTDAAIALTVQDGRADLAIDQLGMGGGGLTGTMAIADLGADGAAVDLDLDLAAAQIRPAVRFLAGSDILSGIGTLDLEASGSGQTTQALMGSLQGQGALRITDGSLIGVNLPVIARGQSGGGDSTPFSLLSTSYTITDGVLETRDIRFVGPTIQVDGGGTVDLGRETLALRFQPKAMAGLPGEAGGVGIRVFAIDVTGSWSNPSIAPDLTGAIGSIVSAPVGALETVGEIGAGVGGTVGSGVGRALGGVLGGGESGGESGGGESEGGGATDRVERGLRGLFGD
ncbi:MAG: AsmA family protein [Pseudomonadota bacterium]